MALPNPGNSISLSQINTELGRSSTAQVSLNTAEDSGYVPINGCSQYRPRAANPAKVSEWYRYNHSATCNVCYNGANAITGSFSLSSTNGYSQWLHFPISFQNTIGESVITFITTNVTGGSIYASVLPEKYYLGTINDYSGYASYEGGSIYTGTFTNATYTSNSFGVLATDYTGTDGLDYIGLYLSGVNGTAITGNYEIRFSCPTITTCGNTLNSGVGNCGAQDWHWLDAGTSSRNITLTYSLGTGWNTSVKLLIKDQNNNVIVNNATVSTGSNQTYTFSFTYTGYRYIKILFWEDYAC
jgi:hypothetical protein